MRRDSGKTQRPKAAFITDPWHPKPGPWPVTLDAALRRGTLEAMADHAHSTRGSHRTGSHPIGVHDVGGRPAPRVEKDEHPHALWEYRVDAMMMLLSARGLLTADELRRHIEGLGAGAYETMEYYERWCAALAAAMIDRGVVTADEIARKLAEVAAREP